MATKTQIKDFLKKTGYTEEDMQRFWDESLEVAPVIQLLSRSGHTWKDLAPHQLEQMPTLREECEASLLEKKKKEDEEAAKKKKEADERAYYEEHFEEIMVKKIKNDEKLTEAELKRLVYEYEIEEIEGSTGRWTRNITTIIELLGRTYSIKWQKANTEYQENEFSSQPIAVAKHTYPKTIMVTEWLPI